MSSVAPTAAPDGADSSPGPVLVASTVADAVGGSLQASSTFWCYECDMSVALVFSSPSLLCPHCGGDFLEEMEERQRGPPPSHFGHHHLSGDLAPRRLDQPHGGHGGDDDFEALDDLEDPSDAEDYYDVFDRLISRIVSSASDDLGGPALGGGGGARPASKSAVEAIPTVQITEPFLAADPFLLCAVCKDEFAVQTEARRLPCGHIYHPGCILPWLSQHNSCPLCRFLLPTEEEERRRWLDRVDRPHVVFGNLLDEGMEEAVERDVREIHGMLRSVFPGNTDALEEAEDDFLDIGVILRRIARRRRLLFSRRSRLSVMAASSPALLAQPEIGSEALANDPDRVSSRFPLDEVTSVGGSGTGARGRVDEEGDVHMSG